jgi:Holliday junction resolvasome RuvABC DNA-binding subunit
MFTEITKTFEANQKLAKDMVAELAGASTAFAKTVVDVNTRLAESFKTQAAEAYKNLEAFKVPGFDAYTAKSSKK